ncbi:RNA-directed DNA polymerase, eukaryota, reverse transcriptase zinc-binding domain protein [Tanacetum coccineum]
MLPNTIIKEIEKLLKGFLWCQGPLTNEKVKVASKQVCLPKDQGGLGIKSLKKWNDVLLVKQLWKIIEGKESLWVKWVNVVKLKGKSIWDIEENYNDSCGWKKLLELRNKIKQHVYYYIGDGSKVSMWFDKWDYNGPICDIISRRMWYDERYSDNEIVVDILSNGVWVWPVYWVERMTSEDIHHNSFVPARDSLPPKSCGRPKGVREEHCVFCDDRNGVWVWPVYWVERFPKLSRIDAPKISNDTNDKVYWLDNQKEKKEFSTKQVWMDLKDNVGKVNWHHVVWYSQFQPRHAFLLWLAIKERLATQDRMGDIGCQNELKSIVAVIAQTKANKNIGRVINILVLAATVYYIWQERNWRIFKPKKRSMEQVQLIIIENVKIRLMSFKVRQTSIVIKVADAWSLKWDNMYLKAAEEKHD